MATFTAADRVGSVGGYIGGISALSGILNNIVGGMGAMINKYINNPALELIGIKTSENTYEINKLYEVAKNEVEKDGIVEIAGIKFDKTDVEKVYKYVINAAGGTV